MWIEFDRRTGGLKYWTEQTNTNFNINNKLKKKQGISFSKALVKDDTLIQ